MEEGKKGKDVEGIKKGLEEEYEKDLAEEVFKSKDRPLTFDEIEDLIDKKMDRSRNKIIQEVIEKGQSKKMKANGGPEETSVCVCGTEVTLCRDDKGNPKVYEKQIQTKRGYVKLKEYGYYCSKCRKVFFPSKERP